ncbi:ceramidase domain-containing protein [Psychromarinibacter halotolerans]|uniref:Ceramidase domain-containing protein n=1 Tax=Psychromarinibacter halotolerans TaxID=1775175 RepID=A0ABV7GUA8_9RHOB|nr:ceramidase domain-containing protein [Psychromarinibacter halotolerans]MDF0597237.1 ceramidase domain-containing protein [Psychromarinibacter halotolerans]
MNWTDRIIAYCERSDFGLWSEPLNAVTNLAFLLAAAIMWARLGRDRLPIARLLVLVLAVIGVSSSLWHVLAMSWTGLADSLSIAVFVLIYLFAANRAFWGLGTFTALLGTALFLPFAAAATWIFAQVPAFRGSAMYWPVALLIAGYALALARRSPATARRLAIGAGVLVVSITFRSLDDAVCTAWPHGTHFMWHLLNAAMLGWMIETYRRHVTSAA